MIRIPKTHDRRLGQPRFALDWPQVLVQIVCGRSWSLGTSAVFCGVGLLYGNPAVRGELRAYVDIIRGMPLIVTIFLLFYGPVAYGIDLSPFQSIVHGALDFAGCPHGRDRPRGGHSRFRWAEAMLPSRLA